MLLGPLEVDIRAGAVDGLARLLADQRISGGGQVAVAVGPGLGEEIAARLGGTLATASVFRVDGGSVDEAVRLQDAVRASGRGFDALVGIGGGRTLDVAKYAATRLGLPMVSVATNLAHDGVCSPVSSLDTEVGKESFGVSMPIAAVVDLDYVGRAPVEMVRSGIGDVVSNLSAIADWELAGRERGERVDGLAVSFARLAAESVLHHRGHVDDPAFLVVLAEALVLSGIAMTAAGSSRPCSGGDHEILHAIDRLFPGRGQHGELAGLGALFAASLRDDGERAFAELDECLARHRLPRRPGDVGLSAEEFATAVRAAPATRPDRFTVLEHRALDDDAVDRAVKEFVERVS
ncbi:iron-containing alcohol dehydrogenase family protein [Actinomycetospora sp. TBRC 11914]|nr:iron-containing alcohol dehydrogenase family protein [Actinomycetospora sp. TBRC 11914]